MNILIIGGTGVLSTAVTSAALNKGIGVTMINRGNRLIPEGVEHIKADKDDRCLIENTLKNRYFDAVIDFLCYTDEETKRSVSLYSKHTKQYIYISSCAVYNTELLCGKLGDEDSPKELSIWPYSLNKCNSEQLLKSLFANTEVNYTIVRPCVTYDNTRIPYGISPRYGYHWTLCARIKAGKPIIRWNQGVNRCNIMRVEDFAVGLVGLIGNQYSYNQAFNICGDETPSWNEVLQVLGDILGQEVKIIDIPSDFYAQQLPYRAGEILGGRSIDSLNSNEKIKKVVPDFHQSISLKEGIKKTIDAYQEQSFQKGIDWHFDADTDRIIKKWLKVNKTLDSNVCIRFVNYLNSATIKDKVEYYSVFYRDSILMKVLLKIRKLISRVIK